MNPSEKQGTLEDLSLASIERLEYLLKRQETILANKSLIRCLPDKGVKVKAFADSLRDRIKLRENDSFLAASFERRVNIYPKDGREDEEKKRSKEDESSSTIDAKVVEENFGSSRQRFTRLRSEPGGGFGDLPDLNIEETDATIESTRPDDSTTIETARTEVPRSNGTAAVKKTSSQFRAFGSLEAIGEDAPTSSEIRVARKEDAEEKRTILAEIFAENRRNRSIPADREPSSKSRSSPFRENVPSRNSPVRSIPKPESIARLGAEMKSMASPAGGGALSVFVEDAVHLPESTFKETKVISLAESVELQKKLKSANESRVFEDAAARLVDRLRGQALPPGLDGGGASATTTTVPPSRTLEGSVEAAAATAVRLLGPRLAERASENASKVDRGNLVEGSFVEYRETRDAEDDIDDVLGDSAYEGEGRPQFDDRAECEF